MAKIIFFIFFALALFRPTEACYPIPSMVFYEDAMCDGGTRQVHICVAEDPKDAYFMSTCLGVPVTSMTETISFLPIVIK